MKNAKRMLALAGMTLAAGAMLGITPAQAAPATAQTSGTATAKSGPFYDWDDQYVVGYYNNRWDCENAGRWGERRGAWADYDCFRAWGYNNWGQVHVLQVSQNDWRWDRWDGGWPRGWQYRPDYYGRPFDVGGYYRHPFRGHPGIGFDWPNRPGHSGRPHRPDFPGGGNNYGNNSIVNGPNINIDNSSGIPGL